MLDNKILDHVFMKRALKLARRGLGRVSPNPMVGAVIVRDGKIIGEGYHRQYGEDHAEIAAIKAAAEPIAGATIYVTLEPCSFFGKTPPCADRLIQEKIERVVVGMVDPDPRVNQRGIHMMRDNGIQVDVGVLKAECQRLLRAYAFHRVYGRPFTTVKLAQSLDGQIATGTGHSQWISGPESRRLAHQLRRENDAVLVGTGTALADNPQLNLRHVRGVNPQRILIDTQLKVPADYRLFRATDRCKTYVVTTAEAPQKKMELLKSMGVQVLLSRYGPDGRIHLPTLWNQLGFLGITSVMVEGGGQLITSLLKRRLVNYYVAAIAPMIIGQGTPSVGDLSIEKIDQAIRLENVQRKFRGQDIILLADVAYADEKPPPPSL